MRTIHCYYDRDNGLFLQGPANSAPLSQLAAVQDDKLQIIVHSMRVNTATPAIPTHIEEPLSFDLIRASIGLVDAAPKVGTFKLKVDNQTTATALTWPSSLTTASEITAWHTAILNALKALSNVGSNGIRLDDLPGVPGHIAYFTWTDATRELPIEVVQNRLIPAIDPTSVGSFTPAGFTQQLKFAQFPFAKATSFTRPMPPASTVIETRAGASGTNAEQTLIIPQGAMGSFSLAVSGASTKTMAIDTLTAAQLATALNEIVADGASNPSFRTEARTATDGGKRIAIEFIGPLAAAAQSLLGITLHDQIARPYAVGILDLQDNLGIEQALNGTAAVTLKFELVVDDDDSVILPIVITNNLTTASTDSDAAAQGLVEVVVTTVYLNSESGGLESYVEASPGFSVSPSVVGSEFVFTHGLNTWQPAVRVEQQISTDPETWRELSQNAEYQAIATGLNEVTITLPFTLSSDTDDPLYFGNFKFFVSSPDAQIIVFSHQHTWDQCRNTLPSGQTVRAKFAAIDAALGILGGTLNIAAGNITGKLTPDQIDLTALAAALADVAAFATAIEHVLNTDSTAIDIIGTRLLSSTTFLSTFISILTSEDVLTALVTALTTNTDFLSLIERFVTNILGTGSAGVTSVIPIVIPAFIEQLPAAPGYLPTAFIDPTSDGAATYLPAATSANQGHYYTASAQIYLGPRKRKVFRSGATIYSNGHDWFDGTIINASGHNAIFAKDFDRDLFTVRISAQMLAADTKFALAFGLGLRLDGNCTGEYLFELLRMTPTTVTGPTNVDNYTVDETIISLPLIITDAEIVHLFKYQVTNDGGTLSATKTQYLTESAAGTPSSAAFAIRGRLTRFDTTVAVNGDPQGQLARRLVNPRASIIQL